MIQRLELQGLWTWTPDRHHDARGWFSETFSQRHLGQVLGDIRFVQDNHSYSKEPGVVRGLHFQIPPMAQDKLIRVVRGSILDVAVDIRKASPTFGRHVRLAISASAGNQLFIPKGFAHGLITLEPDTEVFYKVSDFYSAAHERAILWSDPALDIDWGDYASRALLSDKDRLSPLLSEIPMYFD